MVTSIWLRSRSSANGIGLRFASIACEKAGFGMDKRVDEVSRKVQDCFSNENEVNKGASSVNRENTFKVPRNQFSKTWLPPMIPFGMGQPEKFDIELIDSELWRLSFGLAQSQKEGSKGKQGVLSSPIDNDGGTSNSSALVESCPDFDEIDDLRLHKKLYYKLDRNSKEFEEYSFDFHRRKSPNKKHEKSRQADPRKENKKDAKQNPKASHRAPEAVNEKTKTNSGGRKKAPSKDGHGNDVLNQRANALHQVLQTHNNKGGGVSVKAKVPDGKRVRNPTFNQLTDPYHLPFCLDIFITKGSVRACVVHRATSKVVAVAHSISKDMKFDLTSKKDFKACTAVGKVLALRAIEDDIYNVVYTPRKGDKIEGKLQIVLQSIIDNGVDVKVKLKQKRPSKATALVF